MTLEKLLAKKGLTKSALSRLSGVPKTTISDLCSGKSIIEKCSTITLYKLSKALDCSMEELYNICQKYGADGKPKDKAYLEKGLPLFLAEDLVAYKAGLETMPTYFDCLWGELSGSINSAYYSDQISAEQADYLRKTYLYESEENTNDD